jgi:hypothetical protein
MKKVLASFALFLAVPSAFASASEMQCYAFLNNNRNLSVAATTDDLSPSGSIVITEGNSLGESVFPGRFIFTVIVKNNFITSMKLKDKVDNIVSEQSGLKRAPYMQISLQSKDVITTLECYLNIL